MAEAAAAAAVSTETTVARWRAMAPSMVPVMGTQAPPGGLFNRLAGFMTYKVEGTTVIATCKGLLCIDSGRPCIKETTVVRKGTASVSGALTHFRAMHPYVLYPEERTPSEAEAAEGPRTQRSRS